jgi:hypothetical protein
MTDPDKTVTAVNLAVPEPVRDYWRVELAKRCVKMSPLVRRFLVAELGCPPGYDPVTLKPLASDD